jgi:thioesterase domain-containing protein
MCEGGIIALEIALQLQQEGREVALLAEFDTPVNGYWRGRAIDRLRHGYDLIASKRLLSRVRERFYARKMRRPPMTKHEQRQVQISNFMWSAIRAYRPNRVFQGEIQIFRAPRPAVWYYEDVVIGWQARASKGIRVHGVVGDHAKLFCDPVSQRIIANVIQQARQHSLSSP